MKALVINGSKIGYVECYNQYNKWNSKGWVFYMENKIEIWIPFEQIKLFTSHEDLEIILA